MELPVVNGENPFVLKVEECGLLDKLESLQNHSNQQVYEKVDEIISVFFAEDDEGMMEEDRQPN